MPEEVVTEETIIFNLSLNILLALFIAIILLHLLYTYNQLRAATAKSILFLNIFLLAINTVFCCVGVAENLNALVHLAPGRTFTYSGGSNPYHATEAAAFIISIMTSIYLFIVRLAYINTHESVVRKYKICWVVLTLLLVVVVVLTKLGGDNLVVFKVVAVIWFFWYVLMIGSLVYTLVARIATAMMTEFRNSVQSNGYDNSKADDIFNRQLVFLTIKLGFLTSVTLVSTICLVLVAVVVSLVCPPGVQFLARDVIAVDLFINSVCVTLLLSSNDKNYRGFCRRCHRCQRQCGVWQLFRLKFQMSQQDQKIFCDLMVKGDETENQNEKPRLEPSNLHQMTATV